MKITKALVTVLLVISALVILACGGAAPGVAGGQIDNGGYNLK